MRKVILFMITTLDGFIGGPNGELDWMIMDQEMDKELIGELLSTVDTVLVGRATYQGFEGYWPTVATNPASPPDLIEFARWLEDAPKVVFSKTLEKVEWKNSTLAKENIAEEVAKLKQQPGRDMVIFGGAGIVSAFVELGLIDEFRIKVHPVVLGSGKPLWKAVKDRLNLKLIKAKAYDSGVVALYYQKE
jgi:dihydrofolate reductase